MPEIIFAAEGRRADVRRERRAVGPLIDASPVQRASASHGHGHARKPQAAGRASYFPLLLPPIPAAAAASSQIALSRPSLARHRRVGGVLERQSEACARARCEGFLRHQPGARCARQPRD